MCTSAIWWDGITREFFHFFTWNKPLKKWEKPETSPRDLLPTCQSIILNDLFSHVKTFGDYGGTQKKRIHTLWPFFRHLLVVTALEAWYGSWSKSDTFGVIHIMVVSALQTDSSGFFLGCPGFRFWNWQIFCSIYNLWLFNYIHPKIVRLVWTVAIDLVYNNNAKKAKSSSGQFRS